MARADDEKLLKEPTGAVQGAQDSGHPEAAKSGQVVVGERADASPSRDTLPKTTLTGLGVYRPPGAIEGMFPKQTQAGLGNDLEAASSGAVSQEIARPASEEDAAARAAFAAEVNDPVRAITMMGLGPANAARLRGKTPARPPLAPGTVFAGEFKILQLLAQGGMGAVYEAEQLSTGRRRALKILHRVCAPGDPSSQRFLAEARVKARINSEHVVDVVIAGVDGATSSLWIAMELLEGETLAERLVQLGPGTPMPFEDAWLLLAQLSRGLARAHEQGVVHRDLSPANVYLARGSNGPFTVKILDFGMAHMLGRGPREVVPIGTPLWMAPEQVMQREITLATDVWAVGLIAFRVFTGRPYWLGAASGERDLQRLLVEITEDPLVSATARAEALGFSGRLPEGFDAWFAHCVARDPSQRFRSAREMASALADIASSDSVPVLDYAPVPAARPARPRVQPMAVDYTPPREASTPSIPFERAGTSSRPATPSSAMSTAPATTSRPTGSTPPGATASSRASRPQPAVRSEPPDALRSTPPARTPSRPVTRADVSPRPAPLLALPARTESITPAPMPIVTPPTPRSVPTRSWGVRPRVLVPLAFLLGGLTAYAAHLATRESPRAPGPATVETPTPPIPRTTLTGAPPWPTGTSRAWSGTLDGDGSTWTFSLVLALDNTGSVAGRFAWTATHAAGAHPGDQVTEQVSGTYEPTLNTLELTGVRSTNSVLFPVNAYRLQVLPDGGVVGATVGSTTTRLVGTVLSLQR